MRNVAVFICLLLSMPVFTAPVRADTRLGDGCDLSIFGVEDKNEFLRFDGALRSALDRQDASAVSLFVQFPLRLTYRDGSRISLDNAAALQKRFAEAFPPALHDIVAAQKPEAIFCKADGGVMYGNGEIWVDRVPIGKTQQFRVITINVPEASAPRTDAVAAQIQLACSTDRFHIVIDGKSDEVPRYRSWNKPHAAPDKPAMELVGKKGSEGTGSCFHSIWSFKNGNVNYVVSEPGCGDGRMPEKAKARLEVIVGGKSQLTSWCY